MQLDLVRLSCAFTLLANWYQPAIPFSRYVSVQTVSTLHVKQAFHRMLMTLLHTDFLHMCIDVSCHAVKLDLCLPFCTLFLVCSLDMKGHISNFGKDQATSLRHHTVTMLCRQSSLQAKPDKPKRRLREVMGRLRVMQQPLQGQCVGSGTMSTQSPTAGWSHYCRKEFQYCAQQTALV